MVWRIRYISKNTSSSKTFWLTISDYNILYILCFTIMAKRSTTFLTWLAMWLADLVPWVSWGTIAFMSGLYEKIIGALSWINRKVLDHLLSGRFKEFWKWISWNFLFVLFAWMWVSILWWSRLLHRVMETYPTHLAIFFVGLICASSWFLFKKEHKASDLWTWRDVWIAWLGVLLWAFLTLWTWIALPYTGPGYILAWILGSLAMLLPWISWSYILLIVWMYQPIITAVSKFSEALSTGNTELLFNVLPVLISVGLWVIIWILVMSKILKWLLSKRHTQTVLLLIWVMIGALPAILPTRWVTVLMLPWAIASFVAGCGVVSLFFMKK